MSAPASRALRLEYVTVGWNIVEGALALIAAGAALLGFGLDSLVECLSAGVMIWRLRAVLQRVLATVKLRKSPPFLDEVRSVRRSRSAPMAPMASSISLTEGIRVAPGVDSSPMVNHDEADRRGDHADAV